MSVFKEENANIEKSPMDMYPGWAKRMAELQRNLSSSVALLSLGEFSGEKGGKKDKARRLGQGAWKTKGPESSAG